MIPDLVNFILEAAGNVAALAVVLAMLFVLAWAFSHAEDTTL